MISHPVKQVALRAQPDDSLAGHQPDRPLETERPPGPSALAPWQADPNPVLVFGALGRELGVLATEYHHLPRAFASYKDTLRSMLVASQRTDQLIRALIKAAEAVEDTV